MKKIMIMLLVLSLFLCACGGAETPETQDTKPVSTGIFPESPKEDTALNVFFVSNSTCYYFTDELYGLLNAAGYEDVTLALVYYDGCPLEKHYKWLQEGAANYEFRVLDKDGMHSYEGYGLEAALKTKNWDVISFDNSAKTFASGDVQTSLGNAEPYFGNLLAHIKPQFPEGVSGNAGE